MDERKDRKGFHKWPFTIRRNTLENALPFIEIFMDLAISKGGGGFTERASEIVA